MLVTLNITENSDIKKKTIKLQFSGVTWREDEFCDFIE